MTYNDKIKASNIIINAINGLEDKEEIIVSYGTDSDGMPIQYKINCYTYGVKKSYSIYKNGMFGMSGMNISKVNKTTMDTYTFDMMGQRSTYRFPLYEMKLVN